MSKNVPFPMFELMGPPCDTEGCTGVKVRSIALKTQMMFNQCSVCNAKTEEMTVKEGVDWATRTIEGVLKGEKPS